jgi:hypothetical protein
MEDNARHKETIQDNLIINIADKEKATIVTDKQEYI